MRAVSKAAESAEKNSVVAPETASRRAFLLRRLHSLSGVVPVGGFLALHLWTNATVLGGREPFDHAVGDIQKIPLLPAAEVFGILLPLAFHAFYGVFLASQGRPNVQSYSFGRNWAYVFQRITGVIAFLFVLVHLWELRVQKWLFGLSHLAFYDTLVAHLSAVTVGLPLVALFYLIGVASAVFHFANGLVTFCLTWGLVASRAAQRRLEIAAFVVGLSLFGLGATTVVSLATGTHVSALAPPASIDRTPCP